VQSPDHRAVTSPTVRQKIAGHGQDDESFPREVDRRRNTLGPLESALFPVSQPKAGRKARHTDGAVSIRADFFGQLALALDLHGRSAGIRSDDRKGPS